MSLMLRHPIFLRAEARLNYLKKAYEVADDRLRCAVPAFCGGSSDPRSCSKYPGAGWFSQLEPEMVQVLGSDYADTLRGACVPLASTPHRSGVASQTICGSSAISTSTARWSRVRPRPCCRCEQWCSTMAPLNASRVQRVMKLDKAPTRSDLMRYVESHWPTLLHRVFDVVGNDVTNN